MVKGLAIGVGALKYIGNEIKKRKRWIVPLLIVYNLTVMLFLPVLFQLRQLDTQIDIRLREVKEKLAARPNDPDLLTDLAWIYYETGQLQKGEETVDEALKTDDLHIGANYIYGLINTDLYHYEEAEKGFTTILNVTKGEGEGTVLAFYGLGLMYKQKKDYLNALKYLHEASNRSPKFAQLHFEVGALYWQLGNQRLAEAAFFKASSLDANLLKMIEDFKQGKLKR